MTLSTKGHNQIHHHVRQRKDAVNALNSNSGREQPIFYSSLAMYLQEEEQGMETGDHLQPPHIPVGMIHSHHAAWDTSASRGTSSSRL